MSAEKDEKAVCTESLRIALRKEQVKMNNVIETVQASFI